MTLLYKAMSAGAWWAAQSHLQRFLTGLACSGCKLRAGCTGAVFLEVARPRVAALLSKGVVTLQAPLPPQPSAVRSAVSAWGNSSRSLWLDGLSRSR